MNRPTLPTGSESTNQSASQPVNQSPGAEGAAFMITGAAGFIGYHLSHRLLNDGHRVVGFDNLNDYYDPQLKRDRLARLEPCADFTFVEGDLAHREELDAVFAADRFDVVVNLAAQAGVRYSIDHPDVYIQSNLVGFANLLECCRHAGTDHLVYASSSSVYGMNASMPFSVHDNVDHPVSLYAATKKANELLAHSYSHLYKLPTTGLRFFTVYGPWGRPDMALFLFTKAILAGEPIKVFNHGKMRRDFTFVDDIIEGVIRVCAHPPVDDPGWDRLTADPGTSSAPYRIYNIGNNNPVELSRFITAIENSLNMTAEKNYLPLQPGDVEATAADVSDLERDVGFRPDTCIEEGVGAFVDWYLGYYHRH